MYSSQNTFYSWECVWKQCRPTLTELVSGGLTWPASRQSPTLPWYFHAWRALAYVGYRPQMAPSRYLFYVKTMVWLVVNTTKKLSLDIGTFFIRQPHIRICHDGLAISKYKIAGCQMLSFRPNFYQLICTALDSLLTELYTNIPKVNILKVNFLQYNSPNSIPWMPPYGQKVPVFQKKKLTRLPVLGKRDFPGSARYRGLNSLLPRHNRVMLYLLQMPV